MILSTPGTVARTLVAALLSTTCIGGAVTPAGASVVHPKPATRTVDTRTVGLGCSFTPLDEINVRLDAVSLSREHLVVAGRAPSGGRAWSFAGDDRTATAWGAPESTALRADTAADGTTVIAGRSTVTSLGAAGAAWRRDSVPADLAGPVASVAALPKGAALLLLADGRLLAHDGSWDRLGAPAGRALAVAAVGGVAHVVTAESVPAAQSLRVWRRSGTGWTLVSRVTVPASLTLTPASVVWAAAPSGGALAVNDAAGLAAVVRLTSTGNGLVPSLAERGRVTAAKALPDGRALFAHTTSVAGHAVSGRLSVLDGARTAPVMGSVGDPVVDLSVTTTTGTHVRIATLRTSETHVDGAFSAIATCG